MRFMNEYDITRARRVHGDQPNRGALIDTVDNLREWANDNSDGWAYWPKPCRAAARAILAIVGDGTNAMDDRDDITRAEYRKAVAPIKAFLTRHGVNYDAIVIAR